MGGNNISKKTLNKIYIFISFFVSTYLYFTSHNQYIKIVTFIPVWIYAVWYIKNKNVLEKNSRKLLLEFCALIIILLITIGITGNEVYRLLNNAV